MQSYCGSCVSRVDAPRQALSAVLFLYRHVLKTGLDWLDDVVRARQPRRLPNVLSREEVAAVLSRLEGTAQLVVLLLYGAGMRILECLRLRVQDIDFDIGHITIRSPKGGRDRATMLPDSARVRLQDRLAEVHALHERDLADGFGSVYLPHALARKYPHADREWKWQTHILGNSGGRGVTSPADTLHRPQVSP